MRLDANIRFFLVAMGGTIAPAMMFAIFAWLTGHVPLWWSIVVGVASGLVAVWGGMTFFGILHLERLAARVAHGGRHYYFEHEEIHVVFDEFEEAWMRLADLRRCIGGDSRGTRHFQPAEATQIEGRGRQIYLSVVGVRRYLKTLRHRDKQKFTLWFEREFVAPLERRRKRNLQLHSTGSGEI